MVALKLTSVGDSVGLIMPEELQMKLGAQKGDTLYAVETPDGIRLSVSDPVFEAEMAEASRIMKERRAVLRDLAK